MLWTLKLLVAIVLIAVLADVISGAFGWEGLTQVRDVNGISSS